jgi:uncharacterized protein YdhG (YjbR/CyaY superfamily)
MMNASGFRRIILGLRDAVEGAHMGHVDFRVAGRIFASLNADETTGTVKLPPDDQARLVNGNGEAFRPASGAWGRQGWTVIELREADEETAGEAVTTAWQAAVAAIPPSKRAPRKPAPTAAAANGVTAKRAERRPKVAASAAPVDAYIAGSDARVRPILKKIRAIVREEAPEAEEKISYRMPAFFLGGAVVYYAPFKHHIGMFPPVKGDLSLNKALARYQGEKGNLRFPLDEPMPYPLIRRVVQARLKALSASKRSQRGNRKRHI